MKDHRFSVITICKDAEQIIERTLKSVESQSHENLQYVVIDGASRDKTVDKIKKYQHRISSFISEHDNGIYHAMNKGIAEADGDYIFFLNSGDVFFNTDVLRNVNRRINELVDREIDIFHGKIINYYETSGNGYLWQSGPYGRFAAFKGSLPHPATFYTKKAFHKNGMFDENYKIAGDYEWLVRGVMNGRLKFQYIELITAIFYKGGLSNNSEYLTHHKREIQKLISDYYTTKQRILFSGLNRIRKIIGA